MWSSNRSCCGVVEETSMQVRERRADKPQPWIVLKFAVGLTLALIAYTTYVYVGIFCRDMIVKNQSALASQAVGIVFLVVFSILILMVLWSYILVVTTSPGHAIDFVEKTERPTYGPLPARQSSILDDALGVSYELLSPTVNHSPSRDADAQTGRVDRDDRSSTSANNDTATHSTAPNAPEAHMTSVLVDPETPHIPDPALLPSHPNSHKTNSDILPRASSRIPLTTPILLPEYRYCAKDKIIKSHRTHHCRACGTCVLKYDHHCPWVGHCVGAFNHKFFVNFVQWAAICCFWMFATLLGPIIKSQMKSAAPDLNPQQIVVVALSGLFGIFCGLMFLTQVHLIMLNQTTVESLRFKTMKEREQATLAHMHRWYELGAKRRTWQRWDKEWGRIDKEGNLWWLGSRRANWETVMGKNIWWWFLPVGRGLADGLNFPTNPRFDKEGRWRRRREWPSDLR